MQPGIQKAAAASRAVALAEVRFTSIPDIFNGNLGNPQPGWEDRLGRLFGCLPGRVVAVVGFGWAGPQMTAWL